MLSTPISGARRGKARRCGAGFPFYRKLLPVWAFSALVLVVIPLAARFARANSQGISGDPDDPGAQAQALFVEAQKRFQANPTNTEAAWHLGRAAFDWAEHATNDTQRAGIADEGIATCRQVIARAPDCGPGHYYLGLNLGQLARTKMLGALKLVDQMEMEFKAAIQLNARFDYAGPHRSLGLLYEQSPGWPTSIGSRKKALIHLQKAVELSPAYPENHLNLAEAYLLWGEKKQARAGMSALEESLRAARGTFTGSQWSAVWLEWEQRWQRIKLKATAADPPLKAHGGE